MRAIEEEAGGKGRGGEVVGMGRDCDIIRGR